MMRIVICLAAVLGIGTAYAAIHPQTDLPWSAKGYLPPPPTSQPVHYNYTPPPSAILIPSHRPLVLTPFPPL